MFTSSRLIAHMLVMVAVGGCGVSDPLAPVDTEDAGGVTITLGVSGGFAGVSYTLSVDGADREVVGVSCESFCSFEPGEVLLPLSAEQIVALSGALEEAGVMAWDGRDFGDECCDQFQYELTYVRGERSVHLTGGGSRLPPDLAQVVARLHGLVYGVVPALISPDTRDTDWRRDAYTLGATSVDGLRLTAELGYGGGCGAHRIDLVVWGGWIESTSSPPHINALLTHEDDDPCEAYLTVERSFDLGPLRAAYERAFGPIGEERPTVVLRLWDPMSASPMGRLIEVRL